MTIRETAPGPPGGLLAPVAGVAMTEAQMNATLVAHLAAVEAELRANTDVSLTLATQRLLSR